MTGSEAMKERQKQAKALKEHRKMTVIKFCSWSSVNKLFILAYSQTVSVMHSVKLNTAIVIIQGDGGEGGGKCRL